MSESFLSRWGVSIADDTGYLNTPGFIMRNYHKFVDKEGDQVGLDLGEFVFMSHVMSFKYDTANGKATPSLSTVAKRMGVEPRSARRIKGRLIEKGALTVIYREGETSIYEFSGLAKQCLKYALEEGEDIVATSDTTVRGGRTQRSPKE